MIESSVIDSFIRAACIPMDGSAHVSGGVDHAKELLAAHPGLASANIFTACILGNVEAVSRFIESDPDSVNRKGGPYEWDPLTHLCFSRFLKLRKDETDGFMHCAVLLLNSGANPNTGFFSEEHQPNPTFESAIYGAAGVAHCPHVTKVLLDYGADPNDDETPYHAPEWFDNRAMRVLVKSGKVNKQSMQTLLLRKLDWTDLESVQWLLDQGADPNDMAFWKHTALEHSIDRDNHIAFIEALLDHNADPMLPSSGRNAVVRAAAMGRGDLLRLFSERGFDTTVEGDVELLAAAAMHDAARAKELIAQDPEIVQRIQDQYPRVVTNFAGSGNTGALRILLDNGFNLDPAALHVSVWRERIETVKLLIERGVDVNAKDDRGRTALDLALLAQSEMSEWTPHETRELLEFLQSV